MSAERRADDSELFDTVSIDIDGQKAWVAEMDIIGPDGSPDGRWHLVYGLAGRGDCNHCAAYLVGPRQQVVELSAVSCESEWAWRPDGKAFAFGGWSLQVVSLADGDGGTILATFEGATAPAYAPDGRLFARRNVGVGESEGGELEQWQCVEILADGSERVVAPGKPLLIPPCEECSCAPDYLPPSPVVDDHGLVSCPPASADREQYNL